MSACGKPMVHWTGGCKLYGHGLGWGKDQKRRRVSLVDVAWFGGRMTDFFSDRERRIQTRTVEEMGASGKAFEGLR